MSLKVQGTIITTKFYILKLGGCDIMLGVQWMRTIGPNHLGFSSIAMQYSFLGQKIMLHGLNLTDLATFLHIICGISRIL